MINFRLQRLEYFDSLGSPFGDDGFEVGVGTTQIHNTFFFRRVVGFCCRQTRVGYCSKIVIISHDGMYEVSPKVYTPGLVLITTYDDVLALQLPIAV